VRKGLRAVESEGDKNGNVPKLEHVCKYIKKQPAVRQCVFTERASLLIVVVEEEDSEYITGASAFCADFIRSLNQLRPEVAVISWFCGVFNGVDMVKFMVQNLIGQIICMDAISVPDDDPPTTLDELIDQLYLSVYQQLQYTPVVLMLDSVHQYSDEGITKVVQNLAAAAKAEGCVYPLRIVVTSVSSVGIIKGAADITHTVTVPEAEVQRTAKARKS
jgi:hypothetical protein